MGRISKDWQPPGVRGDMLVHTSTRGSIPIAKVRDDDLIWDGKEFVSHGGAIFLGWAKTARMGDFVATRGIPVFTERREAPIFFGVIVRGEIPCLKDAMTGSAPVWHAPGNIDAIYTILDCGPRHRYACQGFIVHNLTCGKKGCLDGCFSWTGTRCIGLTIEEPIEWCKFYKSVMEAEKDRLSALDATGGKKDRYERGNKRYWLMDITDEFLSSHADELDLLYSYRSLRKEVEQGNPDAITRAKALIGKGRRN